jgi:hypothetical protein
MIWFSVMYILFSLEFILIPEKLWCGLSILLGFFLSLFFVPNFWHVGFLFVASIILFVAYRQIKNDLNLRVRLCLPKTLQAGKTFFVLALALAISSQYYFQAKAIGLLKLPAFDAGVILNNKWTKELLYKLSPDLQKMENENLTVDEFILDDNLQKVEEVSRKKILEAGRVQFEKMVNRKLVGTEKVTTILTESMNQKIQSLVSPNYANEKFPVIPVSMAIILFLTVLSLGAFIIRILVYLVDLIFWILTFMKVVHVKKIPVEMEVIE